MKPELIHTRIDPIQTKMTQTQIDSKSSLTWPNSNPIQLKLKVVSDDTSYTTLLDA